MTRRTAPWLRCFTHPLLPLVLSASGLVASPIVHWSFDDPFSNIVIDASGQGNVLHTLSGAVRSTNAPVGSGSLEIPRASRIFANPTPSLDQPEATRQFSVALWLNPAQMRPTVIATRRGWTLFLLRDGRLSFKLRGKSLRSIGLVTGAQWTHVVATFDGSTARLYLNGVPEIDAPARARSFASQRPFRLGSRGAKSTFIGAVDEVRLFDHVLSPAEVALLATPSAGSITGDGSTTGGGSTGSSSTTTGTASTTGDSGTTSGATTAGSDSGGATSGSDGSASGGGATSGSNSSGATSGTGSTTGADSSGASTGGGTGSGSGSTAGSTGAASGSTGGTSAGSTGAGSDTGGSTGAGSGSLAFNRIRFVPRAGHGSRMVEGRFTGSNESETAGFEELVRITNQPPAGTWTELSFPNTNVYRWIKYEAPPASHGNVAEIEFYAGPDRLLGTVFGTQGSIGGNDFSKAHDGNTNTFFDSNVADDQYVGIDLGANAQVATPQFTPPPGAFPGPISLSLSSATSGATIRFTTDGSMPSSTHGTLYTSPVNLSANATVGAIAYKPGLAPSLVSFGTFVIGNTNITGFTSYHLGNSLTDTINGWLDPISDSAGYTHNFYRSTVPGAPTDFLWTTAGSMNGTAFPKQFLTNNAVDHLSTQPFAGHNRAITNEAFYSGQFYNLARTRSPNLQHWLYVQWPDIDFDDAWAKGEGAVQPFGIPFADTWSQGVANHVFYTERVRDVMDATHGGKPIFVVPGGVALAHLKRKIDDGLIPGIYGTNFFSQHFSDDLHLSGRGAYVVALAFFSSMYGVSPEGRVTVTPSGSMTPEQLAAYQRAAWEAVSNYQWNGVYQDGATPVATPTLTPSPVPISSRIAAIPTSATPGAWFRFTVDGSNPSPTNGLLVIDSLSIRPGATVKLVAFKSGMAPSSVVTATYPSIEGTNLLAHEPFNGPTGILRNQSGGTGWGANWIIQDNFTNLPGYQVTSSVPLTYSNLVSSPGYASGGDSSKNSGRRLAHTLRAAFDNHLASPPTGVSGPVIGAPGRTLWMSVLLRREVNDGTTSYVALHPENTAWWVRNEFSQTAVGYFGAASDQSGVRYWSLRVGSSTVIRTTTPIVPGTTVLAVLRIDSNKPTSTVRLYINPPIGGDFAPLTPSAHGTYNGLMVFKNVAFNGGNQPNRMAIDEIRFGENFRSVTPTP